MSSTFLLFAVLYWVAQAPAILLLGTVSFDPEFADMAPVILAIEFNQLLGILFSILPVLVLGTTSTGEPWRRCRVTP